MSPKTLNLFPAPVPPAEDGPQESFLRLFHRSPDGFVSLARTDPRTGTWQELGAVDLSQPILPAVFDALAVNGRFSLNSAWRAGGGRPTGRTKKKWVPVDANEYPEYAGGTEQKDVPIYATHHPKTKLPYARHTAEQLRWLTCVHTDIDCYQANLSVGEALGAIVDMQDRGEIPPASMFCRSGRGLWLFWFLVDVENPEHGDRVVYGVRHRPDTPARATWKAKHTYAAVAHQLGVRLKALGADLPALDTARHAPIHGTMKRAHGQQPTRVEYWWQGQYDGRPFLYTLPELAQMLGCELKTSEHPVVAEALMDSVARQERRSVAGRRGHRQRYRYLLADLELLLCLRGGGFDQGHRNIGAFYYALALRKSGVDQAVAEKRLAQVGPRCRPPLTKREVGSALTNGYRPRAGVHLSHARIKDDLAITDREASHLRYVPGLKPPRPTAPAKVATAARQASLRRLIETHGVLPLRELADLQAEAGFTANVSTTWRDLKALGHQPQGRPGRPRSGKLFQD